MTVVVGARGRNTEAWREAGGARSEPRALDRVLAYARAAQAKLLGLDAPEQIAIAARQVVEVNYRHVHTLQGETPAVEGTADDPRIRMPADLPSYEQTGWLGEAGATPALAGPNGAHADDAEVVDDDDDDEGDDE